MENQDKNLPLLPDPLEDQPAALPQPAVQPVVPAQPPRRNYGRMLLIFGGVLVLLTLILFGSRLVELLNLRGSKAAVETSIQGQEFITGDWFEKDSQGNIHTGDNRVLFEFDSATNRLMLTR